MRAEWSLCGLPREVVSCSLFNFFSLASSARMHTGLTRVLCCFLLLDCRLVSCCLYLCSRLVIWICIQLNEVHTSALY
jgi:hypothetical protein